ncbi:MAG TPA: hypothetical protein VN841_13390 [Bryobacteraceae bacterium]|nr:hypothetical protein [Bryobacteraceae bacterium]
MAYLALLQSNPIGDALNNTEWAFPLAECFHIVFFGIAIGTIMIVNLRLLGLAFPRRTAAELAQDTWVWTLIGLVITVLAGMMLFLSDPRMYSFNLGFRFKITVFVLAVLYHYTVHAKVVSSGPSRWWGAVVGAISVALWVSVVAGGIFIAFI